ncbi:ATP synthase mitochondrial F1 complex assembly factor 2 [Rhizophagus clarus]|uniref:ATP synthase mitochondrial F1 complex assembly factor 2 n=1 Tax=Rhizophagus clarus TaxID=94130 RepID=A0A8H3QE35_9GLOM|nr:ATP synthase mitochondrial F1 complex assembly factor 2 [Rhizophagus clarus]
MAIHRNLAAKNRIQKQKLNANIQKQTAFAEAKIKNNKVTIIKTNKNNDVNEFSRKLLHSTIGFIVLLIYSSNDAIIVRNKLLYMFSIASLAEVLRFLNKRFNEIYVRVFGFMMREREKTEKCNGVISYLMGCISVLTLFPKDIAAISILILSWCDTAASFAGRRWGHYTYKFSNGKSLAGTLAAIMVGSIAAYIFWGSGLLKHDPENASWIEEKSVLSLPILIILTGIIGGISELIDLWGLDDNLVIPLLTGIMLRILFKSRMINSKIIPCSALLLQNKRRFSSNKQKEEPMMLKRFWKEVTIQLNPDTQTYEILLDKRALKTPGGSKLTVPFSKKHLALLIAGEWESQNHILKQHSLPLKYIFTHIDVLVELQKKYWLPIIDWVQTTYNIEVKTTDGISGLKQSENAKEKLKNIIENFDSLKLSAFERATMISKSFLIGLALVENKLSVEEASKASSIETISQTERWGELDAHGIENEDIKRHLGSVACTVMF